MSKQATKDMLSKINALIGVDESYKAPERIMDIISDQELAKDTFLKFSTAFSYDLSYEWFHEYFEEEHADRKNKKQDFTPNCVSRLISEMQSDAPQYGVIYEPAAGTGSTIIAHWWTEVRKNRFPWDYHPDYYLYLCEEMSDRTIPFLLFNILIRGMNALVVHGNSLTREAKEVYHCDNKMDSFMSFSELRKMPHTKQVEELLNIKFVN